MVAADTDTHCLSVNLPFIWVEWHLVKPTYWTTELEAAMQVLPSEKVSNECPGCFLNLLFFLFAQRLRFRLSVSPPTSSRSLKKKKEKHSEVLWERPTEWEQTTRESAKKSMAQPLRRFRWNWNKVECRSANECGGGGKAMNYAEGCKSSFIKCFGKGQIL